MDDLRELASEYDLSAVVFTKYGFVRKSHSADRIGSHSHQWKGHILLVTEQAVLNEIDVERDLQALVTSGALPMFGIGWTLAAISFSWSPTDEEIRRLGVKARCIVTVTYHSYVENMPGNELTGRLTELGVIKTAQPENPEERPF